MDYSLFLDFISNHGMVAAMAAFLLWNNSKREKELMEFCREISARQGEISNSLTMLSHDLRDTRQKLGLKEDD